MTAADNAASGHGSARRCFMRMVRWAKRAAGDPDANGMAEDRVAVSRREPDYFYRQVFGVGFARYGPTGARSRGWRIGKFDRHKMVEQQPFKLTRWSLSFGRTLLIWGPW